MAPTLEDLPLRARKLARTKLALLDAAVAELDTKPLEAVQVRDLCAAADISQASFFNYFPKKADLLVYFVQLWTLDMAWQARQLGDEASSFARISRIFAATAEQAARHPGVMAEVIAGQARLPAQPELQELSLAERLLAFPGRAGIERQASKGLDSLLPELLRLAIERKELPRTTDVTAAFLGLSALFLGVPAVLLRRSPAAVEAAYAQQLATYWAGLRSLPATSTRRKTRRGAHRR